MPATASINSTNVRRSLALTWQRASLAVTSALAPAKAVARASRLFTTPPRFAHTPREVELLATGRRFDVAGPHGTLAAWRFGAVDRPLVLLTHGWGGRGAQLRAFVPVLLDAGYQPVLFDHPGHGHSSGNESSLVHFIAAIDAVAREVERAGTPLAGIVGHSLGAAAAGAWLKQTRREIRAVLIAPPTSLARYSGYFARKLGIPEAVRHAMQDGIERRLGRKWKEFELPESVAGVRARALVVHDEGDNEVAHASGLALARTWPDARLVTTRGLGHRAILRDPTVARDAVDFINGAVVFAPPPARGEPQPFGAPSPAF